MESSVYNICWEFCYEVVPVSLDGSDESPILILNLPIAFAVPLERLLSAKGFHCTRFLPHGHSAVVMRFEKALVPISG